MENYYEKFTLRFMNAVLESIKNSSFAFYTTMVGVVIQFVHNIASFAGMLGLYTTEQSLTLIVFEWILVVLMGGFFAFTLFFLTVEYGNIKVLESQSDIVRNENKEKKDEYGKRLKTYTVFDIFIDFYFWIYIVFMENNLENVSRLPEILSQKWPLLIVILPVVNMLPLTIRFYAGTINDE